MDAAIKNKLLEISLEVERLYDPVSWLKEDRNNSVKSSKEIREELLETLERQSNICRSIQTSTNASDLGVLYGQADASGKGTEAYDWFPPLEWQNEVQHVLIYIHGGFWRAIDLPQCSHWVTPVTEVCGIFVALAYRLAPWQSIQSMPRSLSRALSHIYHHTLSRASKITCEPPKVALHLIGHSAGAHLAIETFIGSLQTPEPDWISAVDSIILASGIYDLRPLINTSVNTALKLKSIEEAWQCSPLRFFPNSSDGLLARISSVRWMVAWADHDPPGVLEQSQQMLTHLRSAVQRQSGDGVVEAFEIQNEDHFSTVENMHHGVNRSPFVKRILEFVGLLH